MQKRVRVDDTLTLFLYVTYTKSTVSAFKYDRYKKVKYDRYKKGRSMSDLLKFFT